ncbi:hypothetical protein EA91_02522 [Enterococcus faecium]|nr:hypothetical protein [Enterococcus faecium]RBT08876.1 hypothetical protein EA91_02522 [Enterococcus faecium]
MKFFEVKSPYYYALIAAKNEEECAELYEQVVTDIENREEFIRCLHELNRNEAIQEDAKKISEETLQPMEDEETAEVEVDPVEANEESIWTEGDSQEYIEPLISEEVEKNETEIQKATVFDYILDQYPPEHEWMKEKNKLFWFSINSCVNRN